VHVVLELRGHVLREEREERLVGLLTVVRRANDESRLSLNILMGPKAKVKI